MGIGRFIKALRAGLGKELLRQAPVTDPRLAASPMREGFSCGLLNSEQIMAYANNLETGLGESAVWKGLGQAWAIEDRDDALAALADLAVGRHSAAYATVLARMFSGSAAALPEVDALAAASREGLPQAVVERTLVEWVGDRAELELRIHDHLSRNFRDIGSRRRGKFTPTQFARGVVAWDLGRLTTLARLCCDVELLSAEERDGIVRWAGHRLLDQPCQSWDEVAVAYLIGRACTRGADMGFHGLTEIACDLLEDARSPWVLQPLRGC